MTFFVTFACKCSFLVIIIIIIIVVVVVVVVIIIIDLAHLLYVYLIYLLLLCCRESASSSASTVFHHRNGHSYRFAIKVIDLDPKPAQKVPSCYEVNQKYMELFKKECEKECFR